MKGSLFPKGLAVGGAAICVWLGCAPLGFGAEPVRAFIDGLRERGLYDVAIEYVEQMQDSRLAPDEFKKRVPYELGALTVEYARHTDDPALREQLLAEAETKLRSFAAANQGTYPGVLAQSELAGILVERGIRLVQRAAEPPEQERREEHLQQAREQFDSASKSYEAAEAFYDAALKDKQRFPATIDREKQPEEFELRKQFRESLAESRLLVATSMYEKSKAYEPDSEERKALLVEAARRHGETIEEYRKSAVSFYARLYQGRCYLELKDYRTALGHYEDLLNRRQDVPQLRPLISAAYAQAAECLIAMEKYDEAITRVGEWLRKARGAEQRDAAWLAAKYQLALAHLRKSESQPALDPPARRRHVREARALLSEVVASPSDVRQKATDLLRQLAPEPATEVDPQTFAEAYEAGKTAVEQMTFHQRSLPAVRENNPDEAAEYEQQIDRFRGQAQAYLRRALELADAESPLEQINQARYFLCYLAWESGRYYDAAVLGEFLARQYPDSVGGRQGAKIAMAAYFNLYNESENQDREFEAKRLVGMGDYVIRRWPDGDEADQAMHTLIGLKLREGDYDAALNYLEALSQGYADRGKAELTVGQSLWAAYLRKMRLAKDDPARPNPEELQQLKQRALATLENGFERMRKKAEINATVLVAAISLAQLYLDVGRASDALSILEDERLGPLALVEKKHPATARAGYVEDTYKTALRAYVTASPPQPEKAEAMIDALEAHVGDDREAGERLTRILIGLGLQLQDAMKLSDDPQALQSMAQSFETFLDRISARQSGNDWATSNWVASTYFNLGAGLDQGPPLSPQTLEYYQKAVAAYEAILEDVRLEKLQPPKPNSLLAVRMRLAECEGKLGHDRRAIDLLAEILAEKPMMLEVQKAAAYAFQQRAKTDLRPRRKSWYYYARVGGRKDETTGKNRIWGWAKLARVAHAHPQFRHVFFEARYNLALCRYKEALTKKANSEERTTLLNRTKDDLARMGRLFPDLGGETWQPQFDRLAKDVQKALGEKPTGMKGLAPRRRPAQPASAKR